MRKMVITAYAYNEGSDQTAHAQSGQGLLCPLTESVDMIEHGWMDKTMVGLGGLQRLILVS